jgi:hypothetical protein
MIGPELEKARLHANRVSNTKTAADVEKSQAHGHQKKEFIDLFKFPPPNMAEENRKFNEYGERFAANVMTGFDADAVEKLVDDHSKDVQDFSKIIEEQKASQRALKDQLDKQRLVFEDIERRRQELTWAIKRRQGKQATPDEAQYLKGLDVEKEAAEKTKAGITGKLKASLKESMQFIGRDLRYNFDPAAAMAGDQAAANKMEAQEKEAAHLASLAMKMGTRGDHFYTSTFLGGPGATQSNYRPGNPLLLGPAGLPTNTYPTGRLKHPYRQPPTKPNNDSLFDIHDKRGPTWSGLKVPEWFTILDKKGLVKLRTEDPRARYEELMNHVADLHKKMAEETTAPTKEWHEPNKAWPYKTWQEQGGWWACRTGFSASAAEKACEVCKQARKKAAEDTTSSAAAQYKLINRYIDEAKKPTIERLKKEALEDPEVFKEREELERRLAEYRI